MKEKADIGDMLRMSINERLEPHLEPEDRNHQFREAVNALVAAIEAKDHYTGGHNRRVALFGCAIARHMGLDEDFIEDVRLSSLLHDVGKIGVHDHVLKKDSALDQEEWLHMKQHPEMGWKILAKMKSARSMQAISDGMRFHHERVDGLGYPFQLKGEEIPLIARIIAVADTFDAMTSTRPYRKGLDYDVAFEEILRHRGTQFDEIVVDGFIRAFKMERMGKERIRHGRA
jgi:HD-GYP domain-containing protein (c-di-GMP phosphodiesterase class II)